MWLHWSPESAGILPACKPSLSNVHGKEEGELGLDMYQPFVFVFGSSTDRLTGWKMSQYLCTRVSSYWTILWLPFDIYNVEEFWGFYLFPLFLPFFFSTHFFAFSPTPFFGKQWEMLALVIKPNWFRFFISSKNLFPFPGSTPNFTSNQQSWKACFRN